MDDAITLTNGLVEDSLSISVASLTSYLALAVLAPIMSLHHSRQQNTLRSLSTPK
jgi:hypothetical protein